MEAMAATITSSLLWSSETTPFPSPTGTPTRHGHGHGGGKDGGGETLQEWSSLIGIITAIVGNMLIALALNVQRYAHTRLHKERARNRQRANAALKRTQGGLNGPYGSIADGSGTVNGHTGGETDSSRASNGLDDASGRQDNHEDIHATDETAPLIQDLASRRTGDAEGTTAENDDSEEPATSSYLKSPYWWLGQVLITLGEMGNFLAYGFAPASIVSPLGVVALVTNCIIAPLMFHEAFRIRDFWGVVIAVGGVVTVVLSAKQEETKLNPHDVWDHITTMAFEIYLGVTVALIIVLMWASPRYGRRTILIDLGLVGLFGGYTALSTKGVSSMLSSTLWGAFTTPVTYGLLLILLTTAIMQIRYVNKALQRFDSTQVIPIQFVMFTLCVIVGSAVLYRDFEKTTPEQAGKFVGGCLLTFFGVFLITSGRPHDDEEDVLSEAEGIEETIGLTRHESYHDQEDTRSPSQSRRSSRISKAGLPDGPRTPILNVDLDGSYFKSHASPSAQQSPRREGGPFFSGTWQNSWDPSAPSTAAPPRGNRTLSVDSVAVSSAVWSTPGPSSAVTPSGDVQSTLSLPVVPAERPTTPRQGHPKSLSHHRSGTFISPSPFSSTVTTVVKDAFLGPNDEPAGRRSSLRRIRSSVRASLFFGDSDSLSEQQAIEAGMPVSEDNLAAQASGAQGAHSLDDSPRRRSRSLSDTLGEFLRPSRKKSKKGRGLSHSDVEEDEEDDADETRTLDGQIRPQPQA